MQSIIVAHDGAPHLRLPVGRAPGQQPADGVLQRSAPVGKTTTCRLRADAYVNWDDIDDRELILAGPRSLIGGLGLDRLSETAPVVLFDELHKFPRWKQFLKGFFDTHADRVRIAVTGSSRMDVYRRGGDSLMGR